ncbi:hypothetical protein, partial [Phenylobacterium sp.]|uniref:hypothetical protein n=1 Tax=Phenylobacterium sp. TaxID=1871053 RepID=UPI002F3F42A9
MSVTARARAGLTGLAAAALLGWALSAAAQPAAQAPARAPAGPRFFVLGVWVQSVAQMDAWKARGVNTMVEVPQGHDIAAWARAADQRGLYQIRHPSPDLAADLKD